MCGKLSESVYFNRRELYHRMSVKIFVALAIFTIFIYGLSNLPNVYSLEISFPSDTTRVDRPPRYCGVSVDDSIASDYQIERWLHLAGDAVVEWRDKLQSAEDTNKVVWEMNYTQISSDDKNSSSSCDTVISFKPYSSEAKHQFGRLGQFNYADNSIDIFYLQTVRCVTDEGNSVLCHDNKTFRSDELIFNILLHEIGHSLGLGHYVSDDNVVNKKWYTTDPSPSIMFASLHRNPSLQEIKDVDIEKVRSIYGTSGFYAYSSLPIPELQSPPTSKPPVIILPFDSVVLSPNTIEVEEHKQQAITIAGNISSEVFLRGIPVYLVVSNPDLSTFVLKIPPTGDGYFQTPLLLDHNSQRGTYYVEAYYLEKHDRLMDVSFEVADKGRLTEKILEPSPTTKESAKIPDWIKNNARRYAEGTIQDTDFANGIEYLITQGIMKIPNLPQQGSDSAQTKVPDWIKHIAKWWSDGQISDDDFMMGLKYLLEHRILRV